MDREFLLEYIRDHSLEDGRVYIREHISELADHTSVGEWLADEALHLLYTPFLSLKIAELLIFFGDYTHHLSSHALGLKAKGDALVQLGHYEAAIESLDAAGEEFLSLGDQGNWARSRISWILSACWLGRIEDALKAGQKAHAIFLQSRELYWASVVDNNTAIVYEFIGQYQDALKLYEKMLEIFSTDANQNEISNKRSIAIAQVNQAEIVSWLGKFEEAHSLFKQAQESFILLKESSLVIYIEIHLAELDFIQGYYGSALRRYYQALDNMLEEKVENPVIMAELKLNVANCLLKLNRGQEACQLSEEAVKAYRQSGLSLNLGIALSEHARALVATNKLEEAIRLLDEASNLFTQGGFEPYAFATRLQQAEIFLRMGVLDQAYIQAQEVKGYYDDQGLAIRSIHASLLMASALTTNARQYTKTEQHSLLLQEAMSLCRKAILQSRTNNLQGEIARGHHLLGGIFALQNNLSQAAKHFGAAIAQIERILDDLVFDLSPSFLHTTWAVYEDMIALQLEQSRPDLAFYYLEQARSMALRQHFSKSETIHQKDAQAENPSSADVLRTQYELRDWQEKHRKYSTLLAEIDHSDSPDLSKEIILSELQRCEAKLNELFEHLYIYETKTPSSSPVPRTRKAGRAEQATGKVQRIDITQVRRHLSSDQLLLSYYMHEDKLVIFAITAGDLMVHELPGGRSKIENLLLMLHANFQAQSSFGSSGSQQTIKRLLKKLYDLLIAPVASLLPTQSGSLTIVPYDSLHTLPFHCLYNGSRYLIEDYQMNYLPASSLLVHLAARDSQQKDPGERIDLPLLALGYSDHGHLPRVQDETITIASLFGENCYLEEEATIERLIQQAPSSSIIHLATHGQNRLDAPNFSYVRLADGQLNAIDAIRLDLQRCELVVLSGCETGLALSGGGDEQLGLARAFLAAGAHSLVISLWSVEDSSTNELMRHFYQHLLQGESKVQALRSAQCTLLQQADSMYAHPYFWAAFRLVGDVSSLRQHVKQKTYVSLASEKLDH